MNKTKSGFTLVELLIVIVVIAILVAVTVVAYNGIQARAQDAAVYSDMRQFATAVENYRTINGSYPATLSNMEELHIQATTSAYSKDYDNFAYCVRGIGTTNEQFAVGGLSRSLKPYYDYSVQGLSPRVYTGSLDALLGDMCTAVMGAAPDFSALGYVSGAWQDWTK